MIKEISLGLGLASLIFLLFQGINITPVIVFGALGYMLFKILERQGGVNTFSMGRKDNFTPIDFHSIGGQEMAKKELKEALEFIKEAERVQTMGIRPMKGILLTGPPGTGKTLMARAAAGYTDSIFISTSGSEFIEMYAGVGAKRVRKIFKEAREKANQQKKESAIIFIDELEVLGSKRGQTSSHLEYDQTINQLLVEMDGLAVDDNPKLLIIATTNRIDLLDEAILRPGRFDRIVEVNLPDLQGRLEILKIHCKNKPLAADVDLNRIARETFRFSGAHLESLTNEAAILAMREGEEKISHHHFHEAIEKVMLGEKMDRKPGKDEIRRIAIHETGHGIVSESLLPNSVSSITITSRGRAMGYIRHNPREDYFLETQEYLEDQISICVAGAVAEELLLKHHSTGAENDIQQATALAKKMIYSGMSRLGIISKEDLPKRILHRTISSIIERQKIQARELLEEKMEILKSAVKILLEKESLRGKELRKLLFPEKIA